MGKQMVNCKEKPNDEDDHAVSDDDEHDPLPEDLPVSSSSNISSFS
jgi:hypothetical protein